MFNEIKNSGEKPVRADVLLANAYPEYSRAALAKLFNLGDIKTKDEDIRPGSKIKPGDSIHANLTELQKPADAISMPIIYEDNNVIVVDKPIGIISHARGRYWDEASVASFVRDKVADLSGERAGIVHRLDRATSGVMICAKNPTTMSLLQRQFAQRKTKKVYYAVVGGIPLDQEAVIDVQIARNPKDPKSFKPDSSGKSAVTAYKVVKSNSKYSLLELTPLTGRTHQLRVHLKYIKHPIVGDKLYGGGVAERLFLHAYSLEVTIPDSTRKVFISELPKEFNRLVK